MKIAFLLSQFPTLSETFILNQITGLIDLGHEVSLFAVKNPNQEKVHNDIETYQLMERVTYLPPIPQNRMVRQVRALGVILSLIFFCPTKVFRLLRLAFAEPEMSLLRRLYWFRPFAKREFDILHCHFGPMGNIGTDLKRIGVKGKIGTVFHGYDLSRHLSKQDQNIYTQLFSKGDFFFPISQFWVDKLLQLNCDKSKIAVHHMGIDTHKFPFTEKQSPVNAAVNILTVARLTEKKGLNYSLKAVKNLLARGKKVHYTIVGDGPLQNQLKKMAIQLQLQNHVHFPGNADQNEIITFYKKSHLFLLPSVTARDGDQEGIPVVLMEAQACGLPVISTWHTGIPELVIDGKTGFLVPEKDVDALTDKLAYLIENPRLWPEMGRQGRQFVEEHFDSEKLNRRLVEIYQSLVQTQ